MSGTVNTAVEMANLALAHLKEAPIRDFDFSSVASRWFRNHYAAHRDAYLAMHDWDFAIELVNLPAETEKPPFRWAYQYKLPAGTLRIPQQSVGGSPGGRSFPSKWWASASCRIIRRRFGSAMCAGWCGRPNSPRCS